MNVDSPDSRVFENLMTAMYQVHPIQTPILGDSDSIREITPELLHLCHRAFYTPGNMLLCVVGDVNPDRVAEIATEILGAEPRSVGQKIMDWQEEMTTTGENPKVSMEVAMPTFQLGFKCEPVGLGPEAIRQEIIGDLAAEALFGESSQLYLRLYEEGLIDTSFGGGFETIDGMAMLLCSGDSDDPEAVRDAILEEVGRLAKTGLDEQHFTRMKRSAFGRRVRDLDSFDSTCFRMCAYHMGGYDYFRFPELYQQITPDELVQFLIRTVQAQRCSLSVVEPLKEES